MKIYVGNTDKLLKRVWMSGGKWSLGVREHRSLGIIYLPGFTASQDTNLRLFLLIFLRFVSVDSEILF